MAFNFDDYPDADEKSAFDFDAYPDDKQQEPSVSQLESGARGVAQGASFGFADEATGVLEAAKDWLANDPKGFMANYQKHRDESRANYKAAEGANPTSYMAGQFGGALAPAILSGGTSIPALAAQGAAQGLGASEADLTQGDVSGAARDAAIGSAIGGAAGVAGEAISKIPFGKAANYVSEKLGEGAERLAARGLGAERGTIKKLGDQKIREAGRYALDEGITTPFASTDDMIARNAVLKKGAGEEMGQVYKTIDDAGASTFNPLDVASKVDDKIGGFYRSPINRGETNQLENTLESILMRGDQNLPLTEAQALKEELGKVANWKNKLTVTDKERMARDAYGVVSEAIDQATETGAKQIGVEGIEDTLKNAKGLYGKSKVAEELLENKQAREQGNRLFGLSDSIIAGGSLAAAPMSGGLSLSTVIPLAAKKGFEKYGINTGAVIADNLSNIVAKAPQLLGKFAKPLEAASARGGNSLAATHFILQQINPEYRKIANTPLDEEDEREQ